MQPKFCLRWWSVYMSLMWVYLSLSLSKLSNAFGDYFVLYIILEHIVSVALYSEFVYFSNRSYLQVHYLFPLPRLHPLSNSNLLEIPFFITFWTLQSVTVKLIFIFECKTFVNSRTCMFAWNLWALVWRSYYAPPKRQSLNQFLEKLHCLWV